jgi:peptidoglycan hydrolase-like protein with peptidoglycan-binding domain
VRRSLFVIVLAAAIAGATAAPSANAGTTVDPQIAAVQITMRSRLLYRGPVTGVVDGRTTSAIAILQQRLGVTADGIFGPQTRARLFPYGTPVLGTRLLTIGSKGYDVALLRVALAFHGFPSGPFSSAYTPRTARAVLRFQRFAGLPTTAMAGPLTAKALRTPVPVSPKRLSWPVATSITSGYGLRGARFHGGVDIVAGLGTPVEAPGNGEVVYAGWRDGGWGNAVMVAHGDGVRSLVAHLSRVDVHVGDRVRAGQQLGLAGATGDASGPHVHLEVRLRGAYVDPMTALR